MPAISFGYVYDHQDPNQHGVQSGILFTSNFGEAFDAATGDFLFNVTNVPSGSAAMGPSGEHLKYVFANDGTAQNPQYGVYVNGTHPNCGITLELGPQAEMTF